MHIKSAAAKILPLLLIVSMFFMLCAPSFAILPDYEMSPSYKSGEYYKNLLGVTLTGDMRKDIVAVAKSQVGYHEGRSYEDMAGDNTYSESNYTEYGNFYSYYAKKYYGDSYKYVNETWCGMFVSFCAYMAKIPSSVIRLSAQTPPQQYNLYGSKANSGSDYKTVYDLKINGGTYAPLPGDIVFFGRNSNADPSKVSYCHIGIVESTEIWYTDDGRMVMTINTIEGNSSQRVKPHAWKLYQQSDGGKNTGWIYSGTYIAGFGIPAYNTSLETPYAFDIGAYGGTALRENSASLDVYKLQQALSILNASHVISASVPRTGTVNKETVEAIKIFQRYAGIEVDGIVGAETWAYLRAAVSRTVEKASSDFILDGSTLLLYRGSDRNVTLPGGVTTIAPLAFPSPAVKTVTLPIGMRTIEAYAFKNATGLTEVIHKSNESIKVSSSGNALYSAAKHTYDLGRFDVTFVTGDRSTVISFDYGTYPSFPGSTSRRSDGQYLYHFIGWDREFEPVTKNTTYTARYFTTTAVPVVLSAENLMLDGHSIHLDVTADNLSEVVAFSFSVDYRDAADKVRFVGYRSETVSVEQTSDGVLTVRMNEGAVLEESQCLLTLDFEIDDSLMKGVFVFNLACEQGQNFYCTDGEKLYELNVSAQCAEVTLIRSTPAPLQYDYDGNGVLNISDVTAMLQILSNQPASGGVNAPLNISDVTNLLIYLSKG